MNNRATTKIKRRLNLKRVVFLIIGILLVLGLVLPGCAPSEGETPVAWRTLKTPGTLTIGVLGPMGYDQGMDAQIGAILGAADSGTFMAGNQTLNVTIKAYETDEILTPGGSAGSIAAALARDQCDFVVGGFRTEGVVVYREVLMSANKTFLSCGSATESLAHDVITNYARYKWFFRATPFNDFLVSVMQTKLLYECFGIAKAALVAYNGTHPGFLYWTTSPYFIPQVAIVAEDAEWSRAGREKALASFGASGILVGTGTRGINNGLWLVGTTAASITTQLNDILAKGANCNIIYTILSGPVGMTFRNQVRTNFPSALVVGTNVEAQAMHFGNSTLCDSMVFTDGWAEGVASGPNAATFLNEFAAYVADHGLSSTVSSVPLYTAGTYDAVKSLADAMESEGYVDAGNTVKYVPEEIVAYLETNTRTDGAAATKIGFYPKWDGTTKGNWTAYYGQTYYNLPALNSTQVLAIYPWLTTPAYFATNATGTPKVVPWTYNPNDWTMAPQTTHDLIFGTQWSVGIGSQWQWNGTAYVKKCVWPTSDLTFGSPLAGISTIGNSSSGWIGFENYLLGVDPTNTTAYGTITAMQEGGLYDQYGWYNFKYPGTGSLNLTNWISWVIAHYPY
jgi:branched-chain amino acid transport system substrate-binding protein